MRKRNSSQRSYLYRWKLLRWLKQKGHRNTRQSAARSAGVPKPSKYGKLARAKEEINKSVRALPPPFETSWWRSKLKPVSVSEHLPGIFPFLFVYFQGTLSERERERDSYRHQIFVWLLNRCVSSRYRGVFLVPLSFLVVGTPVHARASCFLPSVVYSFRRFTAKTNDSTSLQLWFEFIILTKSPVPISEFVQRFNFCFNKVWVIST